MSADSYLGFIRRGSPVKALSFFVVAPFFIGWGYSQVEYTLTEQFGVSHPQQVVDLDYSGSLNPVQSYMTDANGTEVPFQILSNGHILVQSDLPANSSRSFKLFSGRAPQSFPSSVKLVDKGSYLELSNGLTGVRIAKHSTGSDWSLAPIQGILLRNGTWSATGPNRLSGSTLYNTTLPPALSASTRILEQGPLQVTIEVSYSYNRPALVYGNTTLLPSGSGSYKSTLTLQLGHPSILITDDTDMDLKYALDVYNEVQPNQGRYRGHLASTTEFGHNADGSLYQSGAHTNDAFRDLQYNIPMHSGYTTGNYGSYQLLKWTSPWDRWASNTGWYWMVYNTAGDAQAPVAGFFAGRASLALGAHSSGPGIFTSPASGSSNRSAGITFQTNRRGADAAVLPHVRFHWGIFVGTKGGDLHDSYQVQNIGKQMNLHGGFNLSKVSRYQTTFADSNLNPLYMSRAAIQQLIQRVRTDTAYYQYLYSAEPTARPLLDAWRDTSGAKSRALAAEIVQFATSLLDDLINGNGIHGPYGYWHGGLEMSRRALFLNDLLISDVLSSQEKEKLKAAAVLFANVLWDNDFAPLFDGHGMNTGGSNMVQQQTQYRNMYTLLLANHPMMSGRVAPLSTDLGASVRAEINDAGAQRGSPHYAGAAMGPLLSMLQQMKVNGGADLFRSEDRLSKFAEFYMNLLTPPDPRFGGWRKMVSIGDGSTESSELYGQMGTAFADVDTALSSRLMGAWSESGKMHSGFQGTTILKINELLPTLTPNMSSATYPGYCSVLRNGWGTAQETAVWFVNGTHYSDHRHDDNGSVSMYALKSPLSVDWGSLYSPQMAGAYMHSLVLPESAIGQRWDGDSLLGSTGVSPWKASSQQEAFEKFETSTRAVASFTSANGTKWTRTVKSIYVNPSSPVIQIQDSFSGPDATVPKVSTLNLMAEGAVETPQGTVVPPLRLYEAYGTRKEWPSATAPMLLAAGLNRFRFTGQWGINWDLYTVSSQTQQALLGNWAHTWHPIRETGEFAKANGRAFRERQNFFRLRGTEEFQVVLTPGEKSVVLPQVRQMDGVLSIKWDEGAELQLGADFHFFTDEGQVVLASFQDRPVQAQGIEISGGAGEVVLRRQEAILTVHGAPGERRIRLPGSWAANPHVGYEGGMYVVSFAGGEAVRVTLSGIVSFPLAIRR